MGKDKLSIKICDIGTEFLKKLRTNRRKMDVDDADLSYWRLIKLITKYFKLNNNAYSELVKLEE